ncbi:MAG: YgjP-like metallopeptidase domain-containing protein [Candidatus Margulisiibacteriota bacterium]
MNNVIYKTNKRRQRYSLEINDAAELVVKTPEKPSQKIIDQLITENQAWIKKHQKKPQETKAQLHDWSDPHKIYFRGKKYDLYQSNNQRIIFANSSISIPKGMTKPSFIAHQASEYLPERCLDIAEMMGLRTGNITIRKLRSCWGTCHQNRNITLNRALIQSPDWVSDYVMIHECAHLIHFNHSKSFWGLVAKYTNHTAPAKEWLKMHQPALIHLT